MAPLPNPSPARSRLDSNLAAVRAVIGRACERSERQAASVELLPVVKYAGAGVARLLAEAGLRDLAEGTLQGALEKSRALADVSELRFHLVGHLQRNKARRAARLFSSIHSLDSERLARTLEEELAALEDGGEEIALRRVYLEVNVAREAAKTGAEPEAVPALLAALADCPRLMARLAGLMAMAPHSEDPEASRPHFRRLRELRDRLEAEGRLPRGAGLSMGMSGDFEVAVEEGATVVRVGTRLLEGLLPEETPAAAAGGSGPGAEGTPCR